MVDSLELNWLENPDQNIGGSGEGKKKGNLSPNFSVKLRKPTLGKNISGSGKGKKGKPMTPW